LIPHYITLKSVAGLSFLPVEYLDGVTGVVREYAPTYRTSKFLSQAKRKILKLGHKFGQAISRIFITH
jgi:hypothetical protein